MNPPQPVSTSPADRAAPVRPPVVVADVDAAGWDDTTDVLVVGLGAAGATAALQAREDGADVLVVDALDGGGATRISGGVVYAGATRWQRDAGVTDTVDAMHRYLRLEVGDAVSDATLARFCADSAGNLDWLHGHGVPFEGSLCPVKTSYPTNRHYLYYSGNEGIREYAAVAPPAPRGHRAKGRGLPGASLLDPLRRSAERLGVRVRTQAQVEALIVDASGRVVGAEVRRLSGWSRFVHRRLAALGLGLRNYAPAQAKRLASRCADLLARHGVVVRVRARRGVVLTAGGFIHNRAMVEAHAPAYRGGMPLGTPGCNGSGIRLGQSVGGAVAHLDRVSAWRFINPPLAWAKGIFVDKQGDRYCNEAVYGAKLGWHMVQEHGGEGILVIDDALRREAFRQLGPGQAQWFQQAPGVLNMLANSVTAPTIEALAAKLRIDPSRLTASLAAYNDAIARGVDDPLGKPDGFRAAMPAGPYHAMNCGLRSKRFPCPTLTLGGLVVDEDTGAVKDAEGRPIAGLYAAGRTAVGVSSSLYVSGLSLADCVFSGRRAGRCAAST